MVPMGGNEHPITALHVYSFKDGPRRLFAGSYQKIRAWDIVEHIRREKHPEFPRELHANAYARALADDDLFGTHARTRARAPTFSLAFFLSRLTLHTVRRCLRSKHDRHFRSSLREQGRVIHCWSRGCGHNSGRREHGEQNSSAAERNDPALVVRQTEVVQVPRSARRAYGT